VAFPAFPALFPMFFLSFFFMLICATVALLYGTMAEESGMRVNCQLFVAVYVCGG